MVPFITYDTGLGCVADPCLASAARGGLIEFFAKSHNLNFYIMDIWLFIGAFLGLYFLMELVGKLAKKE